MTSTDDKPLYEIIRDQLISEITSGRAYPAGALLPSVREITVKWTVSTTTARRVLSELVNAGYAYVEGPRGHVSTGPGAPTPSNPAARAGTLTVPTLQTLPADGALTESSTTVEVRSELAPAEAALALRLPDPDAPVVVRRRLAADSQGTPAQLRTSYIPRDLAEGTPLAGPEVIDTPWPDAMKTHTGRNLVLAESRITARHPTDTEAAMLALAPTACLLVRTDITHDENANPVDYTVTLWPGDSTRLTLPSDSAQPSAVESGR